MQVIVSYWEGKYRTCRTAFLEMSRYWKAEKKEAAKDRSRIMQCCKDGIDKLCPTGIQTMWPLLSEDEKFTVDQFRKILEILKVNKA